MPESSTMRTFLKAIRTGRSTTTKALDELYKNRGPALAGKLARANALNGLPTWLRDELVQQGNAKPSLALSTAEFNHIREWPNPEKEKVRQALVAALGPPVRNVSFRWGLHTGTGSVNPIDNFLGPGQTTIAFRSPERNVKARGGPKSDDVAVSVP